MENDLHAKRALCSGGLVLFMLVVIYFQHIRYPIQRQNLEIKHKLISGALQKQIKKQQQLLRQKLDSLRSACPIDHPDQMQQHWQESIKRRLQGIPSLQQLKLQIIQASSVTKHRGRKRHRDRHERISNFFPPQLHIEFALAGKQIDLWLATVNDLSGYGFWQSIKMRKVDADKIAVQANYHSWPLLFTKNYRERQHLIKALPGNPFALPPPHLLRDAEPLVPATKLGQLMLKKILYNPVSPRHCFAILGDGRLIAPGDEISGIFVKEIHKDRILLGYYGEFTLEF